MAPAPYSFPKITEVFHHESYPSISPSRPELSTKGKSVILTGAGSGIGARTALAFAESGASYLALLGRTEKTLLATKASVNAAYPDTKIYTYSADLTDAASLTSAFESFAAVVGAKIDILVGNAGFMPDVTSVLDSNSKDWWFGVEANLQGPYNLARAFVPLAAENAVLISVSSAVAHMPYVPGSSSYHVSKLAAIKLFDYIQIENPGLTVMQYHPGVVATAMSQKSFDAGIPKGTMDDRKSAPSHFSCLSAA